MIRMSPDEFLAKAMKSESCPDDFERTYEEFRRYQEAAKSTLFEFHRVCETNEVPYQLAYGSLIGAVREGGQIPWDYDVDVFVPYERKGDLLRALRRDLCCDFHYLCPDSNPKCRHYIMRLAPIEYRTEAVHVDVFYLVGAPQNASKRNEFQNRITTIAEKRYGKFVDLRVESLGNPKRFASLLVREKIPSLLSNARKLDREYESLCKKYPMLESNVCCPADVHANWYSYPTDMLRDTMLMDTDFGEFRVPVRHDELLRYIYGDYKTLPKVEDCIAEVIYSCQRISYIQGLGL